MRTIATLFIASPLLVVGQSLVSSTPQNRTALLEDFTGIHCGYCPEGHVIAAGIEATKPDQVVIVGVHAGSFAVPSAGEPDFRTVWGTDIDAHFTISGYPAGVINRHLFSGADDLGRGLWEGAVNEVLGLSSPVNLGMESTFDAGTRDLTVNVELLYTANSPGGNDYISVLLKESHIIGWQTDYANGNHPNYDHTHVLRAYITPTWGDEVTTTTAGTSVTRTYTFNVPTAWDISNCEVVAFVSEYQTEVYQAREVIADGGTTLVIGDLAFTSPYDHAGGTSGNTTTFGNTLTNLLGATEDFNVTLTNIGAPADWSDNFTVDGTTYTGSTTISVNDLATATIDVNVVPGPSAGIGTYTLTVASVNYTTAPVLEKLFHVISGVTDLIVTNPQAEPHEALYENGLVIAAQANRAKTTRAALIAFGDASALGGVNNIYYNVSWTFPSLTDESVAVLEPFLDGGGNMMIAGQDIGWDQSGDAAAYGTPITQAFYTDHMYAEYVADGSTANSSVDFVDADFVFGNLPTTTINTVFGASSYPEEITPLSPATSIFTYNVPTKIGGLRVQTGAYKLVYFGTGPEQMSDASVGEQMIKLSHDWFYGIVGVDELDAAFASLLGGAYPVPASDLLTVPVSELESDARLELIDATGRIVITQRVSRAAEKADVNVSELASGTYTLRLISGDRAAVRPVTVAH